MKIAWVISSGALGLSVGAILGFIMAMAVAKPRFNGTFGMREVLAWLPGGAIVGLLVGLMWALMR